VWPGGPAMSADAGPHPRQQGATSAAGYSGAVGEDSGRRCALCDGVVVQGRTWETAEQTHDEYRCADCGAAGRESCDGTSRVRRFGAVFHGRGRALEVMR